MAIEIIMSPKDDTVSPRCAETRARLRAFAQGTLGPVAKGEVQGHLLECDACGDAYAEAVLDGLEDGSLPMVTPATVPPAPALEGYPHAARSWRAVLAASLDPAMRDRVRQWIEEIRVGLLAFARPPMPIRVRGAVRSPDTTLMATVLTPTGEPAGAPVPVIVRTAPSITGDGRFQWELHLDTADYIGRVVRCALALDSGAPLEFAATIRPGRRSGTATATFDDERLPASDCQIPLDRVTLTIA